jgi:hypothetical protein
MIRAAILASLVVTGPAHAQGAPKAAPRVSHEPPSQRALGALADFGAAYSSWTTETRCRTLDEKGREEFGALIGESVAALSDVFPPETVSSVAGAGAQMANDPEHEVSCLVAASDVRFGVRLARDALTAVKALPPGFKMIAKP